MKSICRLFFAISLGLSTPAFAELSGRIISIEDGDTLTLLDADRQPHKIRLLGIDAPERNQDFGPKARTNLSAMAFEQTAQADCRSHDRDRYALCVVRVGGQDLGLAQIKAGFAWWYREEAKEQSANERADYAQAEFLAKIHRYGLWNSTNPTPPWAWRPAGLRER
jgi:endonuclease YncB( thermonuclease family)